MKDLEKLLQANLHGQTTFTVKRLLIMTVLQWIVGTSSHWFVNFLGILWATDFILTAWNQPGNIHTTENSKHCRVAPIPPHPFHLLNIYQYIIVICFVKLLQFSLLQLLNSFESSEKLQKSKKKSLLQFSGRFSLHLDIQSKRKSTLQDNPLTGKKTAVSESYH